MLINSFYYTNVNKKPVKISCFDKMCNTNETINILPMETYLVLDATNRLRDTLCIIRVNYTLKKEDVEIEKYEDFYFKIVSEVEFDMYKELQKPIENVDENGNILKPKAHNNFYE